MRIKVKYKKKIKIFNIYADAKLSRLIEKSKEAFEVVGDVFLSIDGEEKLELDLDNELQALDEYLVFRLERAPPLIHLIDDPNQCPHEKMVEFVMDKVFPMEDAKEEKISPRLESEEVVTGADYIFLVFHAIMIYKEFVVKEPWRNDGGMPKQWKLSGGNFYKITYLYTQDKKEETVECTATLAGGYLTITGVLLEEDLNDNDESMEVDQEPHQIKLRISRYINKEHLKSRQPKLIYKGLKELKIKFKDGFASKLLSDIEKKPSLLNLPRNLKSHILSYLDARSLCRLGQTCRMYHRLCNEDKPWKGVLLKETKTPRKSGMKEVVHLFRNLKKETPSEFARQAYRDWERYGDIPMNPDDYSPQYFFGPIEPDYYDAPQGDFLSPPLPKHRRPNCRYAHTPYCYDTHHSNLQSMNLPHDRRNYSRGNWSPPRENRNPPEHDFFFEKSLVDNLQKKAYISKQEGFDRNGYCSGEAFI